MWKNHLIHSVARLWLYPLVADFGTIEYFQQNAVNIVSQRTAVRFLGFPMTPPEFQIGF